MSLSEPFIRRPIATSLLMAAILLLGLLGYRALPVATLPTIDYPTIDVTTGLPGASPEVMSSSVTTPLETQLGTIPGLVSMSSASTAGKSEITLTFALSRNIDSASQDVQSAISAAASVLPHALPNPPTYNKVNPANPPILTLALTSQTVPAEQVNDYAETILLPRLSQIDGVGLVSVAGGKKRAVRLQVDPQALASLGLSLEQVRAAVTRASVNAPKGTVETRAQSYTVGANDQIVSASAYDDIILGTHDGAPVRLRDVGRAVDGVENAYLAGWSDRTPAVIVEVSRQPGANVIQTVERIRKALPQLRAAIPAAVTLDVLTDGTTTIRASIADIQFTLMLTVALVILVIFIFLRRFWITAIPSVALPLSLIGTFSIMRLAGFTLDNLSLMALTLASGFVVDDAIVMIENIVRHLEAGEPPLQAAIKGAKQISFTVISLTLSLIAVFIPLLLMGGIVGRLFREFAVTVSVAVAVSAVVSLTLTPTMCASLLGRVTAGERAGTVRATGRWFEDIRRRYERSLIAVLARPRLVLTGLLATLIVTITLFVYAPKGFLPEQDTGLIAGTVDASETSSFAATVKLERDLVDRVLKDPAVLGVESLVGENASNAGRLLIRLKPRADRTSDIGTVIRRLQAVAAQVPGIVLFMQPVEEVQLESRVSRTQYQYTLQEADMAALSKWAPRMLGELRRRPELADVASDQQTDAQQAIVEIDRPDAERLGISMAAIDDVLYDAFGQRQIATIYTQLNQYHVILQADPRSRQDPQSAFSSLYVVPSDGVPVPLDAIARYRTGPGPLSINHLGRFPAITLSFNLAPGYSLGDAVRAIAASERSIGLPPEVITSFSGAAEAFRQSLADEPGLILAGIAVVYIVLGILYESFIHPLTILSTLPTAGIGAMAVLWLGGYAFDLMSLIGIFMLIGIVKKNAIMMIDFALDAERGEGLAPRQAIIRACLLRFRPIMMTTMAALFGALPLALGTGPGSELRQPMGVAIVGGLLVSQILTLYTTPVVYLAFSRLSAPRLPRRRRQAALDVGVHAPAAE